MTARVLSIDGRRRSAATSTASLDDFEYREGPSLSAQAVLDGTDVSLYCLDPERERAIFVRAPCSDLQAAPFFYDAQYRRATELIAVPYERFLDLAATLPARRMVFIYSTGRCGSTLVSHAFRQAERVVSWSEPDVFTQLALFYAQSSLASSQLRALADASLKLLHPSSTRDARLRCCVLKFRGSVVALGELFHALVPEARVIFLYRDLTSWVRSCARSLRSLEPSRAEHRTEIECLVRRILAASSTNKLRSPQPLPPLDLLVCSWIAAIRQCRHLQRQGVQLLSSAYASLECAPEATLAALLDYCDLRVAHTDLQRLCELDAQADTALSRAMDSASTQSISVCDARIRELLHRYAPDLSPDYRLPGTLQP